MIGNNSGGVHSVMAGLTVDNVESLDILTYDGTRMTVGPTDAADLRRILDGRDRRAEIYRRLLDLRDTHADTIRTGLPKLPRRVSGYANIDWLLPENGFHVARALVGTEATCVSSSAQQRSRPRAHKPRHWLSTMPAGRLHLPRG
jgi:FAD/FMN-containing dehydrogenase